jgi:hypothetical protein
LLLGLLRQKDIHVDQFPVKEVLYKETKGKHYIRGNGFTLYHLQDNMPPNAIDAEILKLDSTYDLIIFSSVQRQYGYFIQYLPFLDNTKVWLVDGEDSPALYPYQGHYWRNYKVWHLPRAHRRFLYFKREWTPETIRYLYYKIFPHFISKLILPPTKLRPISFSIPSEKIIDHLPLKTKLFPAHIVDEEVSKHVEGSFTSYAFETESEYYRDLQMSRFGITTRRSGWDCLRHYEIAANGSVICFRDLHLKPKTCAPHGLHDGINCISYSSYEDLMKKIQSMKDEEYTDMQAASLDWVRHHSCETYAERLLKIFAKHAGA